MLETSVRPLHRPKLIVLVVGQVPPPMNGQSLMIREFLNGTYDGLHLIHVPMAFSRSTAEIGAFGFRKLLHLLGVLGHIWQQRLSMGAQVLYFPPAGANLNPVLRDLVLLIPTRWLFKHTVFHFHAAGLSNIYERLPGPLRLLFRWAYDRPDLAIFTTSATSAEAAFLHARSVAIVPCGAPDPFAATALSIEQPSREPMVPRILFAGILCESKGISVLLEAALILRDKGQQCEFTCIGAFQEEAFERQVQTFLDLHNLAASVVFPGVLTGEAKCGAFQVADIFCFPSYYPAESFGVVLIEAMSYSLPIIATDWQGIPEVLGAENSGLLVPVKDPLALAKQLQSLLQSQELREEVGNRNRKRFLGHYTLEAYHRNLERSLLALATTSGSQSAPDAQLSQSSE